MHQLRVLVRENWVVGARQMSMDGPLEFGGISREYISAPCAAGITFFLGEKASDGVP